jgi:hypothetical protein
LREERNEGAEGDRVARGLQVPAVHIDRVAEGLERVEADAHRQHHVQPIDGHGLPQQPEGFDELVDEEVGILEIAQQPQVQYQADTEQHLAARCTGGGHERITDAEVHEGAEADEHQEPLVPPAIEHIAGQQ